MWWSRMIFTDIQRLLENLYRVDLAGMTEKLSVILGKLDATLGEIHMKEINRSLTNLLVSLNAVASSSEWTNALASARQSLDDFRLLSAKLRDRVDNVADAANETLAASRDTLAELRTAAQDLRDLLGPQSPLRHDLDAALDQAGQAARSIEGLADFLKQHPNALLSGRKSRDSKP